MNKEQFMTALRDRLSVLPQDEMEGRAAFCEEMIDNRIREGMTEEEAVNAVGTVDQIAEQALSEIPLSRFVRGKVRPKRKLRGWEIILLVLGSPVWIPLVAAALVVLLAVYIVIWAFVICVFAVDLSFAAGAVISVLSAIQYFMLGKTAGACFMLGVGSVLAGLSILVLFAGIRIARGTVKLGKRILIMIKSFFIRKGDPDRAYA